MCGDVTVCIPLCVGTSDCVFLCVWGRQIVYSCVCVDLRVCIHVCVWTSECVFLCVWGRQSVYSCVCVDLVVALVSHGLRGQRQQLLGGIGPWRDDDEDRLYLQGLRVQPPQVQGRGGQLPRTRGGRRGRGGESARD